MESSSILSDGSSSSSVSRRYAQRANSDEEVILASNRPKRSAGRKKFRETRHPVYRGVRQRNNNKWVCEVREPNKKTRIWLGTFQTAEMAARAHDVAALALRGRSACLNFADSVWRLPQPVSTDPRDIRKAAMDAAEAFHESSLEEGVEAFHESSLEEGGGGGEGGSGSGGGCGGEVQCEEKVGGGWEGDQNHHVFYLDEDFEYGMPGLLDSLAEGLLLSPPAAAPSTSMGSGLSWDDDYSVSLWSYSI